MQGLWEELKKRSLIRLAQVRVDRADTSLAIISSDPFMDNIRDDPRFVEILKQVPGIE